MNKPYFSAVTCIMLLAASTSVRPVCYPALAQMNETDPSGYQPPTTAPGQPGSGLVNPGSTEATNPANPDTLEQSSRALQRDRRLSTIIGPSYLQESCLPDYVRYCGGSQSSSAQTDNPNIGSGAIDATTSFGESKPLAASAGTAIACMKKNWTDLSLTCRGAITQYRTQQAQAVTPPVFAPPPAKALAPLPSPAQAIQPPAGGSLLPAPPAPYNPLQPPAKGTPAPLSGPLPQGNTASPSN